MYTIVFRFYYSSSFQALDQSLLELKAILHYPQDSIVRKTNCIIIIFETLSFFCTETQYNHWKLCYIDECNDICLYVKSNDTVTMNYGEAIPFLWYKHIFSLDVPQELIDLLQINKITNNELTETNMTHIVNFYYYYWELFLLHEPTSRTIINLLSRKITLEPLHTPMIENKMTIVFHFFDLQYKLSFSAYTVAATLLQSLKDYINQEYNVATNQIRIKQSLYLTQFLPLNLYEIIYDYLR